MINKRIFGSPIPINVQKKLEARQLAAIGDKKPLDEINCESYGGFKNDPAPTERVARDSEYLSQRYRLLTDDGQSEISVESDSDS